MSQIYGIHNSRIYKKNDVLGFMPSDNKSLHNPYRSISDHMYNAGNTHDNNAPNLSGVYAKRKLRSALASAKWDQRLCCPREKVKVLGYPMSYILIIYCWMNAQADLSHRYMSRVVRKPVFGVHHGNISVQK